MGEPSNKRPRVLLPFLEPESDDDEQEASQATILESDVPVTHVSDDTVPEPDVLVIQVSDDTIPEIDVPVIQVSGHSDEPETTIAPDGPRELHLDLENSWPAYSLHGLSPQHADSLPELPSSYVGQ